MARLPSARRAEGRVRIGLGQPDEEGTYLLARILLREKVRHFLTEGGTIVEHCRALEANL